MAGCFVGQRNLAQVGEAFPQPDALQGFPPTVIVTCQRDGLRPSGEAFADDLRQRGVDVDLRMELGTIHGHLNSPGKAPFERTMSTFAAWLDAHDRRG